MSGEELSEENVVDHSREELIARVAVHRQRRAAALEDFDRAEAERVLLREEREKAETDSEGWEERFQEARDQFLISKGRLLAHIEMLRKRRAGK